MKTTMSTLVALTLLAGGGAPANAAWSQMGVQKGQEVGLAQQAPSVVWTEEEQRRFWTENENRGG